MCPFFVQCNLEGIHLILNSRNLFCPAMNYHPLALNNSWNKAFASSAVIGRERA